MHFREQMDPKKELPIFTSQEIANYVVCPEAWRLKQLGLGHRRTTAHTEEVQRLKQQWVTLNELSAKLRYYAIWIYALLVIFVCALFVADRHLSHRLRGMVQEKLHLLSPKEPAKVDK